MRGRKPLSTAIKEASGAFKKNPNRKNKSEPKAKRGWPNMPEFVNQDAVAKDRWLAICAVLDEMNVLTTADESLLARLCINHSLYLKAYEAIQSGNIINGSIAGPKIKPEATFYIKLCDQIRRDEAELGLTPSSRSRLKTPEIEENDPFAEWLRGASDN